MHRYQRHASTLSLACQATQNITPAHSMPLPAPATPREAPNVQILNDDLLPPGHQPGGGLPMAIRPRVTHLLMEADDPLLLPGAVPAASLLPGQAPPLPPEDLQRLCQEARVWHLVPVTRGQKLRNAHINPHGLGRRVERHARPGHGERECPPLGGLDQPGGLRRGGSREGTRRPHPDLPREAFAVEGRPPVGRPILPDQGRAVVRRAKGQGTVPVPAFETGTPHTARPLLHTAEASLERPRHPLSSPAAQLEGDIRPGRVIVPPLGQGFARVEVRDRFSRRLVGIPPFRQRRMGGLARQCQAGVQRTALPARR